MFLKFLRTTHNGFKWKRLSSFLTTTPTFGKRCKRFSRLADTSRERDVLQLAATGSTNREIGEMLGISYRTVEDHRFNIMHKLGVKNIAELLLTVLK